MPPDASYAAYWLWQKSGVLGIYLEVPFLIGAVLGAGVMVPPLFLELLYQAGYQGMQGAKVLDPQPTAQPGREIVAAQKAHGDAQVASEAEALSLLNPRK